MGVLDRIRYGAFAAGLTGLTGLAAVTNCYSPSVRDCSLSCASAGDCTSGQVCGADGMCASPEIAGRCAHVAPDAGLDAGVDDASDRPDASPPRDAGPEPAHDAAPPVDARPDAPPMPTVVLTIQITGKGSVTVGGIGTCTMPDPRGCMFDVPAGRSLTLQASGIDDEAFVTWMSLACAGQSARCTFTPVFPTTVSARFGKSGPHRVLSADPTAVDSPAMPVD